MIAEVGFCLLDSAGAVVAQRDGDRAFYAASTVKLAVMAAAARAVDAGTLAWNRSVKVRSVFSSAVAGAPEFTMVPDDRDDRMPPDGTPMSVIELVHAMIRRSSNEATDLLTEVVGLPAIAAALAAADATGCRMERLIGDAAARDAGATNEVTPRGLARLLHRIVTGALASRAATAVMIDTLRGQEFPCIAETLPVGAVWGSKSGWIDGIEHDVAFVGDPGSAGMRVLAVCTRGFEGRDGRAAIRRIARTSLTDLNGL